MIYAHFINRMKAELDKAEQGLRTSQVIDYHRDHMAIDDTAFTGFFNIITEAQAEADIEKE